MSDERRFPQSSGLDEGLVALLRCPATGARLRHERDPSILAGYNGRLRRGELRLDSGSWPQPKIESLFVSEGDGRAYPVIDGIPLLTPQSRIVAAGDQGFGRTGLDVMDAELQARFQAEMEHYSRICDRWYGTLNEAIQRILRQHYYERLVGATVLDVGNGGAPPATILGPEIAPRVARYVGIDKSWPMLTRTGADGLRMLGDALTLPFADGAVDWILVNGVIHHLGLKRGQPSEEPIGRFLGECLRVARRGIIIFELTVPCYAELVERAVVASLGFMATFVYSPASLLAIIERLGYRVGELRLKGISELVSPFSMMPPILTREWLRVPIGLIPYRYIFGTIAKPT